MAELLGLAGVAQAGKDATADVLEMHGWKRTYMSEPLERSLLALNPLILVPRKLARKHGFSRWGRVYIRYQEIHVRIGYEASKTIPEVRELLQRLGTEVGRKIIGLDTWLNVGKRRLEEWLSAGHNVAITGIRYPNELDMIHELGGCVVWVERGLPPINGHDSDNSLTANDCDYVLNNLGTLKDLRTEIVTELLHVACGRRSEGEAA